MDRRIAQALNHIEAHLSQVFNLNELAVIACLSPSQFHRLFKIETGSTPFRFCQQIKLHSAYETITTTDTSILDLSIQLGYKDYETFSRAFKKQFHLAPGDMKAIVEGIKLQTKLQTTEKIVVAAFDDNDISKININELLEIIKTNNLSADDLQHAQIFTITKKGDQSISKNVIKNKFVLAQDKKIWQKLISEV